MITQTYTVPRTKAPLAAQLAKLTEVAGRIDVGELAYLDLSQPAPPVVASASATTLTATMTFLEGPTFATSFTTPQAQLDAVAQLFVNAYAMNMQQDGITVVTTIT